MRGVVRKAKSLIESFFSATDCESCHKLRRALCLTACESMKPVHDRWDKKVEFRDCPDLLKEATNATDRVETPAEKKMEYADNTSRN